MNSIKRIYGFLYSKVTSSYTYERDSLISLWNALVADKVFLIYGLFWCIAAFGFELFNFTGGIDDELYIASPFTDKNWVCAGRFTYGYVLDLFFNNMCLPFFGLFFSLVCAMFAYWLIFRKDNIKNNICYLSLPIYLACPILFYAYSFRILAAVIGFGFFTGAISVVLFHRKSIFSKLLSIPVGVVSIGCYQALFPCILAFSSVKILQRMKESKKWTKKYLDALLSIPVFGAILYFCYSQTLLKILDGRKLHDHVVIKLEMDVLFKQAEYAVNKMLSFYEGSSEIFSDDVNMLPVFFVLCFIFIIVVGIINRIRLKEMRWCDLLLSISIWVFLIFLPFTFTFLTTQNVWRTCLAFSITLAALLYFAWVVNPWSRLLLGTVSAIMIFQFIYVNSKMSYNQFLHDKHDERIAEDIRSEILKEARLFQSSKIPFFCVGRPRIVVEKNRFIPGASYSSAYFHNGGSLGRIHRYLQSLLIHDFYPANGKDFKKVAAEVEKMPFYPAKGSIRYINGYGVVKFSELTEVQKKSYGITNLPGYGNDGFEIVSTHTLKNLKETWQVDKMNVRRIDNAKYKFEKDGALTLFDTKVDTRLFLNLPKAGKENVLELDFESDRDEVLQIFFDKKNGSVKYLGYVFIKIKKGVNHIVLRIPEYVFRENKTLRVDPGNAKGRMLKFSKIKIYQNF